MVLDPTRVLRIGRSGSIALFLVALFFNCYYVNDANSKAVTLGWGLLALGWIPVLKGTVAWLANPAVFMAWYTASSVSRGPAPMILSGAAFVFAGSFLGVREVLVDESGTRKAVTAYGAGYWLWLASIAVMFVACSVDFIHSRRVLKNDAPSKPWLRLLD